MELIADVLLAGGAFCAAFYCFILQRRLTRFNHLENGMGNAVAVLSVQVDELTRTLASARNAAGKSAQDLETLTVRSEAAAARLELLLSSLHDLPVPTAVDDEPCNDRPRRLVRVRTRLEAAE